MVSNQSTLERPDTQPTLVPDLVERWSVDTPDDVALSFGDRTYTWRQWWDRLRRLATALDSMGVSRGDRVAFLDKNHPACLETTIAAASLGAATVILNWRLAADEIHYALTDSGAKVVLVGAEFRDLAAAAMSEELASLAVVVVSDDEADEYEPLLAAHDVRDVAPAGQPDDAALVIYSSGTTGRPKGVVLSHAALVSHTMNLSSRFPFDAGDINLVAMPMFHVGGICWALLSVHAGKQGIVVRNPDAPSLLAGLAAGATHAFFVPPVVAGLVQAGPAAAGALRSVKMLGYGAAPMPVPLLRRALDAWPHVGFVQVYGQTEISGVAVTLQPEDHRDPSRSHLLTSVGTALPGVEVRVVDPTSLDDLPPGQRGEILFRSKQVMSEYLNQPEATAQTLTSDGWLRTGDIGRMDEVGYLYVEDRLKDMIISGGENVYGPEVERVLLEHNAVVDAAVIGMPDPKWGEAVRAVIVTSSPTSVEDIMAFCRQKLAGYKCPSSIDFVEDLPRNASGKLLKRDLRARYRPTPDSTP